MKVCCVFSLASPHRGDSNEYTQYIFFNIKKEEEKKTEKKITLNYYKSAAMGFFPRNSKNEFEIAMVNQPSVFGPLKFYCIMVTTVKTEVLNGKWHKSIIRLTNL